MGFLDDFTAACETYVEDYVELEIVEYALYDDAGTSSTSATVRASRSRCGTRVRADLDHLTGAHTDGSTQVTALVRDRVLAT